MIDKLRMGLFWKVGIYYGVCLVLIIAVLMTYPEWLKFLPFGGLDVIEDEMKLGDQGDLVSQLLTTTRPMDVFDDAMNLLSAMAGAIIIMIPLRWIYMAEGLKSTWNREVATSLLVLPLVVTAIVYVVKYSLPLAFALTGIFAGVRYRTTLKNQSDAFFTFACIAVGLAAGIRSIGIGLMLAAFFAFTILAAPPGPSQPKVRASSDDQDNALTR